MSRFTFPPKHLETKMHFNQTLKKLNTTVLPAKSESEDIPDLQSYRAFRIERSLVC